MGPPVLSSIREDVGSVNRTFASEQVMDHRSNTLSLGYSACIFKIIIHIISKSCLYHLLTIIKLYHNHYKVKYDTKQVSEIFLRDIFITVQD